MKQYALVTGASSGIGLRYAQTLARQYKYNVLLISNQAAELQQAADAIQRDYGVETQTLCIDLAEADAADKVYAYCQEHDIAVEVLINDAGMLIFEPLSSVHPAKLHTMLMLHVVTLTHLCRLFGNDMAVRGRGYILNMSSMTAWMAMPGIQCYNATKSYVLNFSRAYWYEMRRHGVHVLAVTPGSTDTGLLPFDPRFARLLRGAGITMSPERLVARVLKVLFGTWRKRCMPGAWNYIIVPIINHLPDRIVFTAMRKIAVFQTPPSSCK